MLLKDKAHEEVNHTPTIIRDFRSVNIEKLSLATATVEIHRELELRLHDWEDKLRWRLIYYRVLLGLLIAQNIAMYALLFLSTKLGIDVKALSIVATATLVETYGLVKIIVDHLVTDIQYRD